MSGGCIDAKIYLVSSATKKPKMEWNPAVLSKLAGAGSSLLLSKVPVMDN